MVEEKTQEKKLKLDKDQKKLQSYVSDHGVRVIPMPPDRVLVEFSVVGLAFNDLYRFFTGYGDKIRLTHEQPFEDAAIRYVRAVFPNLKIKKAEEVRIGADNSATIVLRVQKFPNHIGEDWTYNRSLPYIGMKSIESDVVGYGKGNNGKGFIYSSEENFLRKTEPQFRNDPYEDMKEAKPEGKKTAALDETQVSLTQEEKEILKTSEDIVAQFILENKLGKLSHHRMKEAVSDFIERKNLWDKFPGVNDVIDFVCPQPKVATLYRLKEGKKIQLSQQVIDEYLEVVK